jgi:predicted DNA-binding transcriptional regulator AlpA
VKRWAADPKSAHLNFPRPIQLGDNAVGFYEHEIDEYLANRPRTKASEAAAQASEPAVGEA